MKYHITTYGCQMNKSDSERIAAVLEKNGFKPAKSEKQADLVVVNACSVRQSAVDRIYGKVRAFAKLKIKNAKLKIILTGCVLGEDREKLKNQFDYILNIDDWKKISNFKFQIPNKSKIQNSKIQNTRYEMPDTNYFHIKPRYTEKFRAYVPIMTGCNNFCSYCAVPYVRGREASRDVGDVLAEVKKLAKNGCLEIILLGQNVNAYQPADVENFSKKNLYKHPFAALLWEINQIPSLERVHFTAPHPADMSDEVIDALTLPKMVNYLHLPVQAGDDEVLKRMNRNYTARDFLNLVEKIRKKKPDIVLGTDIIVGFPGETKKQFENTLKLYKKVGFDIAYLAMYSPRAGTAAAKFVDDVPRQEKKRRWNILQDLMKKITLKKNKKYVGKVVSVLVDEYKDGKCFGNSLEMKRVRFSGKKGMVGKIFEVKIKKAFEWILDGRISTQKKFFCKLQKNFFC